MTVKSKLLLWMAVSQTVQVLCKCRSQRIFLSNARLQYLHNNWHPKQIQNCLLTCKNGQLIVPVIPTFVLGNFCAFLATVEQTPSNYPVENRSCHCWQIRKRKATQRRLRVPSSHMLCLTCCVKENAEFCGILQNYASNVCQK